MSVVASRRDIICEVSPPTLNDNNIQTLKKAHPRAKHLTLITNVTKFILQKLFYVSMDSVRLYYIK